MSIESKAACNPLQMELTIRDGANTLSLFRDSVYNNAHNALEVYLKKNRVQQHVLD